MDRQPTVELFFLLFQGETRWAKKLALRTEKIVIRRLIQVAKAAFMREPKPALPRILALRLTGQWMPRFCPVGENKLYEAVANQSS